MRLSEATSPARPRVLVVGATGDVGGRVVSRLLWSGHPVRALVRPDSIQNGLPADAEIAIGDLLDAPSLAAAVEGVDTVVSTATGYRSWQSPDPRVDSMGNRNLIDVAERAGVARFVFTSALAAERARHVEPFWLKHLTEQYLASRGIPHLVLRPGAIIGCRDDSWARGLTQSRLPAMTSVDAKISFIHVDDLARYLADAVSVEFPAEPRIDIGSEPVSFRELAAAFSEILRREIRLRAVPWPLASGAMRLAGTVYPKIRSFHALMALLASGDFVADSTGTLAVFGEVPLLRDTLERYVTGGVF